MNIKQALQLAIKYETKVRDAYREVLKSPLDEKTKNLFDVLARQEHAHLEFIRNTYTRLMEYGDLKKLDSEIEIQWLQALFSLEEVHDSLQDVENKKKLLSILKKIAKVEKETSDFYLQVSQELEGEESRFFEPFINIEQKHFNLILSRILKITRPDIMQTKNPESLTKIGS